MEVTMFRKISRLLLCSLFLLAAFSYNDAISAYIEGIDTTDANGYGMDSAFNVSGNTNSVNGEKIVYYYFYMPCGRYFNYSFDDIKLSPSSPRSYSCYNINGCFITKRNKDNTFTKFQILQKISGNRYLFRYGANTTPNDTMLIKSDYDRSILYKPSNVHLDFSSYNFGNGGFVDSLFWDPPLPNNNHLIGYTLYKTKQGTVQGSVIDTTAPINLVQWDSLSLPADAKALINWLSHSVPAYFNIVADYTEGKSDFLKGWTCLCDALVNSNHYSKMLKPQKEIEIRRFPNGYIFKFTALPLSFSINTSTGRQVSTFPSAAGNPIFWNTSEVNISPGLYLIIAEFPDHTVLTQPFMFTK
jgi:hypothetical protein